MDLHLDLQLIIINLISFSLMCFIMYKFVWPKLNIRIQQRRYNIEYLIKKYDDKNVELIHRVENVKMEQEKLLANQEQIILKTREEAQMLRAEILETANRETKKMFSKAEKDLVKIQRKEIESIRAKFSKIIITSIKKILENVIDEELDNKITEEYKKAVGSLEKP